MKNKIKKFDSGFTLVELVITMVISSIIILGIAGVMADAPRGFNQLYNKVNSDVQSEADIAKIIFESNIRKASSNQESYSYDTSNGKWMEVKCRKKASSESLDGYSRFYVTGKRLIFEQGDILPRKKTAQTILSENVSDCKFKCSSWSAPVFSTSYYESISHVFSLS